MFLKKITRIVAKTGLLVALLLLAPTFASATPIDQYASTVLGYSSTWNSIPREHGNLTTQVYTPSQALGAPDVFAYGENWRAWAPRPVDGTLEYISLGFATPVFADGVTIRETLGNGFVYQVDVLDMADQWHTVWAGSDPSPRPTPTWNDSDGTISNFLVSFPETTNYLVDGVRIRVNTNSILGRWEEIDSVTFHGIMVPESGSAVLLALGLLSLACYRLRQKCQA